MSTTTFRKRIKLGKGLYVNLSKGGISLSGSINLFGLGKISLNASPKTGIRRTISIPGTGISNRKTLIKPKKVKKSDTE